MADELKLHNWRIYYADGEFARLLNDPLLGVVQAYTKADAERKGRSLLPFGTAGAWAVDDGEVEQ